MKLNDFINRNILLCKVVLWRIVSVISMLLTMWVLTGNIGKATGLTIIVQIIQTLVHATFEVWWRNYSKSIYRK
mgnify:CR=1 FL=1